jgi:hypothetical protein
MTTMTTMTTQEVIKTLKEHKPETVEDLIIYCEFPLKHEGGGAFREVYHILGTNLVVKVPIIDTDFTDDCFSNNIEHARIEYRSWKRIMRSKRKYKSIQPLMPEFHYFNAKTGIALVERYTNLSKEDMEDPDICCEVARLGYLVSSITKVTDVDIETSKYDNIGFDVSGNFKIIDLGCFEDRS